VLDCYEVVEKFLPLDFSVFAFDFSGSGRSEGEYVSLGFYESEDLRAVVDFLRLSEMASKIVLWGRSMGAASILRYASTDPNITCVVLDSPFS
jgi:pimeloyl-ACP methyl ester carboxylesterase